MYLFVELSVSLHRCDDLFVHRRCWKNILAYDYCARRASKDSGGPLKIDAQLHFSCVVYGKSNTL